MTVVAFDALGTLFDLGDLEPRMAKPLHHATSLTLAGEWLPLAEIVAAVDPDLAEKLKELDAYPDAREALSRGDEAWVLTNGGKKQTRALLERNGLDDAVAEIHSVEEVKAYKPHPHVYRMLPPDSLLVAAHAWDVVGARAAGYAAVWVSRDEKRWPFPGIEPGTIAPNLVAAIVSA